MWEEKEITVGDLRELVKSNEYDIEIATPDGWQKLGQWFDKGELPMVSITTESGLVTECATNHMIQSRVASDEAYGWVCEGMVDFTNLKMDDF
ncbi:MAG: hypothetical protein HC836_40930 [Richelia sp. RM2_1_2]|nr:hypothetical protein [Richelia sp. RM2_1_2]